MLGSGLLGSMAWSQDVSNGSVKALFWEGKPPLEKRLLENHEILVSVINENSHARFQGGGLIRATADWVSKLATDPARIQSLVPEIQELDWDPSKGPFKARIKMLWLDRVVEGQAKYRVKDRPKGAKEQERVIEFSLEKGLWFSIKGTLEMREYKNNHCLAVVSGETLEGETLSWPVRVGLEAVLQRMAGTLRKDIESRNVQEKGGS